MSAGDIAQTGKRHIRRLTMPWSSLAAFLLANGSYMVGFPEEVPFPTDGVPITDLNNEELEILIAESGRPDRELRVLPMVDATGMSSSCLEKHGTQPCASS